MSVLITGGAGYIGSHTAKLLSHSGSSVVVLDNLSKGHEWAVRWGPLVIGDISDQQLVLETVRTYDVEAVIHFAADAYVGESMAHPRKYFRNNVEASLRLFDTLLEADVRSVVFSSSCSIYGNAVEGAVNELCEPYTLSPYAESKLFIEKTLSWYQRAYGLNWVALRYFNAAGADADGETGECHDPETHLVPLVIQAALGLRPFINVFGTDYATPDGTAIRDYIHVWDLAFAHVQALRYLAEGGAPATLNLGTGTGHSVREIIAETERITGSSINFIDSPRRPGDPARIVADASLARKVLGWYPRYSSLESIIQTALNWSQHRRSL